MLQMRRFVDRKFMVGAVCGAMLAGTTAVYAEDAIRATLFPAQYALNGVAIEQTGDYATLLYQDRAYVPIRFVAEQLDTVVAYEDATQTIKLDTGFGLSSISGEVKAGYIKVVKDSKGEGSTVTGRIYAGQAYWDALANSKAALEPGSPIAIKAYIAFYDENNRTLGKVPISVSTTAKGDRMLSFTATSNRDLSSYAFAALEQVIPEPIYAYMPPIPNVADPTGVLEMEQTAIHVGEDQTQVQVRAIVRKDGTFRVAAELHYYDDQGKLLGNTWMDTEVQGAAEDLPGKDLRYFYYEMATQANLSDAVRYTITVHELESLTEK
ncbi:stalk domain-containing protein [Paenibacillus sp. strain BS8-2]